MATETIRIGIVGAGRMGLAIIDALERHADLRLASVWVRNPDADPPLPAMSGAYVSADLDEVVDRADVAVDFSLRAATGQVADAVRRLQTPLVCGVSGLGSEEIDALNAAAAQVPIVYDRNMSQGIAVLHGLARRAAESLGEDFAIEIHETHHVHKKDAPSGTALQLGESIAAALGPDGHDAIHYESQRRGEVPGDHDVIFTSPSERLVLSHSVTTRAVFAEGALRAAHWLILRRPGLYSMRDVLFGNESD